MTSKFALLSRKSRDHEFSFPVILVPVVQEGLYVTQKASNVVRGGAWGTPNHSRVQEPVRIGTILRGKPGRGTHVISKLMKSLKGRSVLCAAL